MPFNEIHNSVRKKGKIYLAFHCNKSLQDDVLWRYTEKP